MRPRRCRVRAGLRRSLADLLVPGRAGSGRTRRRQGRLSAPPYCRTAPMCRLAGYRRSAREAMRIAAAAPRVRDGASGAPPVVRPHVRGSAGPMAGVVLRAARGRHAERGDRARDGRRPHRKGRRRVDRAAGRLDDGARVAGPVRAGGELGVDLDRALPRVPRALRPAAAADGAPRPRGAARVLGLVRVLQRREPRRLGPVGVPAPRVPARAHALGGVPAGPRRRRCGWR